MKETEVLDRLRADVVRAGGLSAWGRKHGVSTSTSGITATSYGKGKLIDELVNVATKALTDGESSGERHAKG